MAESVSSSHMAKLRSITRNFKISLPEINPEYYIQVYDRELSISNTEDGFYYQGSYYGSSTRLLNDVIDGDGNIHPFVLILFQRRTDGPDREISRFDSADISDQLEKRVQQLYPRIANVSRPTPVDKHSKTDAASAGRLSDEVLSIPLPEMLCSSDLQSTDGHWSVSLKDLHRWRGPDQPYDPLEICRIQVSVSKEELSRRTCCSR